MSSNSVLLPTLDTPGGFGGAISLAPTPTPSQPIQAFKPQMPVHCFGDSHMEVFSGQALQSEFPFIRWSTTIVQGATASGLPNPNSQTRAAQIFADALSQIPPGSWLVCCLGEVDMGFVVWLKSASRGTTLLHSFLTAVKNYEAFLRGLAARHRLIVLSAPLPTIRDGEQLGLVGNLRREVTASQRDRTSLTLAFNKRVGRFCRRNNVVYVSLDDMSLDPTLGIVKSSLRHRDAANHHYCPEAYSTMIAMRLRPVLSREWINECRAQTGRLA